MELNIFFGDSFTKGYGLSNNPRRGILLSAAIAIADRALPIFPLTVSASEFTDALGILIQGGGFGPITSNTIVLNWFRHPGDTISSSNQYHYAQQLRTVFRFGCNLVALCSGADT